MSYASQTEQPGSAAADEFSRARFSIPLTVGVVGHRDLFDVDRLTRSVREFLIALRNRYPDTPIQILTALAEGADQLAAKVALEIGLDFVAVLPMARNLYEQDFSENARCEFDGLLRKAIDWFELPPLGGATREQIAGDSGVRNQHYTQAGAFIAHHSQIFIALWDGVSLQEESGTAEIVAFRRCGIPETFILKPGPLDVPDTAPVYQIVTRRRSTSDTTAPPEAEVGSVRVLLPNYDSRVDRRGEELGYYTDLGARINEFNRTAARFSGPDTIARSVQDLVGAATLEQAVPEAFVLSPGLRRIAGAYSAADAVSLHFQKRSASTTALIFGLGASMVLTFALFSSFWEADWPLLAFYLVLFASVATVHRLSHARDSYNSFLDARALAEALRVQFFWRATGSWEGAAHHYLRNQSEELRWIRDALRSLELTAPIDQPASKQLVAARAWIRGQSEYFARSANARQRRLHRIQQFALSLYGAGLAISLFDVLANARGWLDSHGRVVGVALMLMGLAPAFAALGTGYAEFMSFEEDVKRHERMKSLFALASAKLELIDIPLPATEVQGSRGAPSVAKTSAEKQLRELLLDLGSEALRENADWLLLHRHHQPKANVT